MLSVYWFPWRRDIGTIVTGGYLPGWISKTGSNGRLLLLFFEAGCRYEGERDHEWELIDVPDEDFFWQTDA